MLFILISCSLGIKLTVLPSISKSNIDPLIIVAINPLFSTPFPCFISVVKFLIINSLVKFIEASDIFPENP